MQYINFEYMFHRIFWVILTNDPIFLLHSTYCPLMQCGLRRNWKILMVVSIVSPYF